MNTNNPRSWFDVCSDLGAIYFDLLYDKSNNLDKIRFRFPIGHEEMCLMYAILKLLLEHGYDVYAVIYGFSSPRQIDILFDGFDTHKCNEFILQICRPAMIDKFINEYIDTLDVQSNPQFSGFQEWLNIERNNNHFNSHKYLAIDALTAYSCSMKGVRMGNYTLYCIGRKKYYPF